MKLSQVKALLPTLENVTFKLETVLSFQNIFTLPKLE